MTHRGFREGVRSPLVLIAWLILGGCSSSSKVPATPKCFLASDCQNLLQCVQGYCVKACAQSRDCPNGERCITAAEGNTCQPLETATCQYNSQCTKPLVCAFDQKCRDQCQQNIDCPTGQMCTSITHLCADPTIDKNYNPVTNEFVATNDGGLASGGSTAGSGGAGGGTGGVGGAVTGTGGATGNSGGSGGSDAGIDAAVPNPGDDSGAGGGSSGGGDAGVDAPVGRPGDSGTGTGGTGGGSGGATSLGGAGGSSKRDAGKAGSTGTACSEGLVPAVFGNAATSDSDPHYTSGVGLLTATEFLTFNAYVGPDSTDAGATESRIDVQHFDPISGKSKGEPTTLLTAAAGTNSGGIYITGADIAPTGEIAIIYSAHSGNGWGDFLAFFDKTLTLSRTTQFVAWGSDQNADSSFVKWLNGEFVASSTWYNGNFYVKVGYFAATGANAGGTNALPTDDPSSIVDNGNRAQGEVAFSGGTFAVEYLNYSVNTLYLTLLDTQGDEVGTPVSFSPAFARAGTVFVSVAGTAQGFVAVYNGSSSAGGASLLATFVSNSASGDAGVPVGATYAFPGGQAYAGPWSVRGSSDGTGAGFVVHYPDGSVSFLYFGGDGSPRGTPQTVLYQQEPTTPYDEVLVTNFGGTFAVSLFSSTEHSTQVIASTTCQ